jgi:4-amino-4-deoxy-L-arabinose transferase-like glycosyltransferase
VPLNSRAVFAVLLLASLAVRALLAWRLPLFGDEAFYWWESTRLAAGYSDVPGATPWLIALGTWPAGATPLGVRWPFLLLAATIPVLVTMWASRFVGAGEARMAGALSLLVPLAASLGVLALPDVPLTVATLATAIALENATRSHRWRDFIVLGLCLAAGWLTHYRFVMTYVAGLVFVLFAARGTWLLRMPRFWLAQAIGLLGLAPALRFNFGTHWSALQFQFVERHPWSFHAGALLDPVIQALVTTPLLFVAIVAGLLWALRRARTGEAPWDVLAGTCGGLLVGYLGIGLFADAERVRFHWPLPAFLLALPVVPALLRQWRESAGAGWRIMARTTIPVAFAGMLVAWGGLAVATLPARQAWLPLRRPIPDNLQGWREAAGWAERLAESRTDATLVADHFMLGAQWTFALRDARPVFVLDHPLNAKHGRATQLRVWDRDEAALGRTDWRKGLVVVEETSRREIERPRAYLALCDRFGSVRLADELSLFGGRWRFVAFAVTPRVGEGTAQPCELPAYADVDQPGDRARVGGEAFEVRGWAFKDYTGVSGVRVLLDGTPVAEASYGGTYPGVSDQWPELRDPNLPDVGFSASVPLAGVAPGSHRLEIEVTGTDGTTRRLRERTIVVGGAPE